MHTSWNDIPNTPSAVCLHGVLTFHACRHAKAQTLLPLLVGQHMGLDPAMHDKSATFPIVVSRASQSGAPGPSQHAAVMPAPRLQPTSLVVIWQMDEGHCRLVAPSISAAWASLRGLVLEAIMLVVLGAAVAVAMAHASRTKAQRAACNGRQEWGQRQAARTVKH